jgi:signal transduction histidine kinase
VKTSAHPIASQRSLNFRLVLATLSYSFVVALVVSGLQIYWAYQQAIERAQEGLGQIEQAYLPNLISALWDVDENRLQKNLDAIAQFPYVGQVELIDEQGSHWRSQKSEFNTPLATRNYPLVYAAKRGNYPLGSLQVTLSKRDIISRLKERITGIAITTSITLLLGSLFVLILFRHWVSRHLIKMADFAGNIALEQLDRKLQLERKHTKASDELDIVVNAINNMQATLKEDLDSRKKIEQELAQHRENLAKLVAERTAQLQEKTKQLELQTQALEVQNRELDAYAHSVAHDLKNPLTTIIGMASVLNNKRANISEEKLTASLAVIERTGRKMSSIINALLLLANIRRADEVTAKPLNLRLLAQEACTRLELLAQQHSAHITFVGAWPIGMGYGQWIEEVWVNYLSNAIKYGGAPAQIEIGCDNFTSSHLKCWVRDQGEGIALERQAELFVQFSRLDEHSADGHGLGLSIVKRIVQRLDGDVGYNLVETGGSCFWFTLPLAKTPTE